MPSFALDAVGDYPLLCNLHRIRTVSLMFAHPLEYCGPWDSVNRSSVLFTQSLMMYSEGGRLSSSHKANMSNGDCSDHWCLEEEHSVKPVSVAKSPSQISKQPNSCHYMQNSGCWEWSEFCRCGKQESISREPGEGLDPPVNTVIV